MSPSSTVPNLTASAVAQHANSGNTTILGTTTPSSYAGASGGNNAAAAAKSGTLSTAVDGSTAFEFTLTPAFGYEFTLTDISFGSRGTTSGPLAYALRSSADAYATNLGSGTLEATSTWALKSNSGISLTSGSSTTFRLFGYGGTGSVGTANWKIDDLKLTVTLTQTGPSDTIPPVLQTVSPADNATSVFPNANLLITYDEPVIAGTGSIVIKKSSDNSEVETITLPSSKVQFSGETVTINPGTTLNYTTSYYVEFPSGTFKDLSNNLAPPVSGAETWNFTTRVGPSVVISQYYEGASNDKFVELKNLTGLPVLLDGYRLTAWSGTDVPIHNQEWKTGVHTTDRETIFDNTHVIPANGHILIMNQSAQTPAYAKENHDIEGGAQSGVIYSGTASIVLYSSASYDLASVVDAVSVTANEGTDISFYRKNNLTGFDFLTGSSILNYPDIWGTKTPAQVAAADPFTEDWYLSAINPPKFLILGIDNTSFSEGAGAVAATGTVSIASPAPVGGLDIFITSNNPYEAVPEPMKTIPAGQTSVQFSIAAPDDDYLDGDKQVLITVSASGFTPGTQSITVVDEPGDDVFPVVINEVDVDSPGPDTAEFIELYNNSNAVQSLDGMVLVLYNGGDDLSYDVINLDGFTVPANGYFVVGSPTVPNVNYPYIQGSKSLQNGPEAIALYIGLPEEFPNATPATTSMGILLDAVVYDTNDADDTGLINPLTPGHPQVDESGGGNVEGHSMSRVPNGGLPFNTSAYQAKVPTPGVNNVAAAFSDWVLANAPGQSAAQDHDDDGVRNAVEYFFGATGTTFTANPQPNAAGLISFPHPAPTPGTGYVVKTSPDLVTWTPVTTTESGGFVNYTIPPNLGKIFVRLEVVVGP